MKTTDISSKKKKILLISYHFPPSSAVGGIRIASFAKYFPLSGWKTYVLTLKDHYLKKVDPERLKDIGEVKIIKTCQLPSIMSIYLRLKTIYYSILRKRRVTLEELERSYVPAQENSSGREKIWQKIRRYLFSMFITLPDLERRWIAPAVLKAVGEIKRQKIDCILTSSPPVSVHIIGLLVKNLTGVRWVADFRDPWTRNGKKRLQPICGLSMKIEYWLEKKVIQKADVVLTTTEMVSSALKRSYGTFSQNKFLYVPNGFDMELFSRLKHLKTYDRFTLTYTGTLYLGRTPEPIFQALKELILERKLHVQDVSVKLVGNVTYVDRYPISKMIRSYGLDTVVEVLEQLPYFKALEIIRQSHLALLLAPDQPFQIPAKAYDYIGLRTQILALAEDGATSDLINSTKAGRVFSPTDIKGIKEFIYQSITNPQSLQTGIDSNIAQKFDRKLIAQNLAKYLSSIL